MDCEKFENCVYCGNVLTNGECTCDYTDNCVRCGNKFRELDKFDICPTCQAESDSEDEYSHSVGDCVFCGSILTKHGDCKNCNFEVDCKKCGIPHSRDFALCQECRYKDESEEESEDESEEASKADKTENEAEAHPVFWYIIMAMRALISE
jgi:hypothetical protein